MILITILTILNIFLLGYTLNIKNKIFQDDNKTIKLLGNFGFSVLLGISVLVSLFYFIDTLKIALNIFNVLIIESFLFIFTQNNFLFSIN